MNAIASRQPIRTTDADGTPIVRVPLARAQGYAVLLAEDFDVLTTLGFSPRWMFNMNGLRTGGTVRVACTTATGCLLSVGQLITEAPPGSAVQHVDGDRRNLRRDNLRLVEHPRSRGREAAEIQRRREQGA